MTFKDLKKRVTLEAAAQQQQFRLTERLHYKPFWIWNVEEHKQEDIKTDVDCCFNHIIGLPQKDGNDKPLYDYEKIIFDPLTISRNSNADGHNDKHLWIKKCLIVRGRNSKRIIIITNSTKTIPDICK